MYTSSLSEVFPSSRGEAMSRPRQAATDLARRAHAIATPSTGIRNEKSRKNRLQLDSFRTPKIFDRDESVLHLPWERVGVRGNGLS
jgi:hypothetical protein